MVAKQAGVLSHFPLALVRPMTRPRRSRLLIATLVTAAGACTDVLTPAPTFVAITEIEVTNETDSGTLLEVEVHLYDARSGFFLGCSGEADGLGPVDESDIPYFVTAFFGRAPDGAELLTVEELEGRDVFVVVVEDDQDPCPVPTNDGTLDLVTDDLIGTSPVFRGEDLHVGVGFGFDAVTWVTIEGVNQ